MISNNEYLIEVIVRENRERIQKEAENARNLRQIAEKGAENMSGGLVILEKLTQVRGKLSTAINPLRWSFR